MKILTGKGTSDASTTDPRDKDGRGSPSSAAAGRLRTAGLRRMLDCIRAHRAGQLPLPRLVNELEYHLQLLGGVDSGWEQLFFRSWRDLERLNAVQLNSGAVTPSPESLALIHENLEGLHALIADLLASAETR